MTSRGIFLMRLVATASVVLAVFCMSDVVQADDFPPETSVYYDGGKRGHIDGCRRLTEEAKAAGPNTTLAEMQARGGQLCSRCPGSELNKQREAGGGNAAGSESSGAQSSGSQAGNFPDDTPVYYDGGKRGHIDSCPRLTDEAKAAGPNTTYGEMTAKGGLLCSRCPGSALNIEREAEGGKKANGGKDKKDDGKYGRKGAKAREAWLDFPEKEYDPNTIVYCDALWMRVHAEDSPALILKDRKKTMTLEQADKEGWRIGESGQSGRERSSLQGYRRKYPEKEDSEDTPGIVQKMKNGRMKWHNAGCHRFSVSPEHVIMTQKEVLDAGGYVCVHCIERGPSLTTADMEALKSMPSPAEFTPPAGWTPKPFSTDQRPSGEEIDLLIQETLAQGYGIQEAPYEDPLASLEEFMGRRFFFPVDNWLTFYQVYRGTGDKRILDSLRVSGRHYRDLCVNYPDVAQLKAKDPEGMAFMYSMAVSARLTLQLARKHPDQVSQEEIAEAEGFLEAIVSTLKPVCEGDDNLDPEMGIPKPLADDFKSRAFNRALNGIGTLAMATAALEDLQALRESTKYQPQIARYRKCIEEYFKNWKKEGCLFTEADGKTYFYYPYSPGENTTRENGLLLGAADDAGHYSHSMQGVMLVHDATPELGADDEFMTAVANAILHNSSTKNGSIQCPSADKVKPLSRHPYSPDPQNRFYMFEAFREGVIEGQNSKLKERKKEETNSEYEYRLKTLHAQFMKAAREDPDLVYLGGAQ